MLLQDSGAIPTIIRDTKPSDLKALARLYTSALASNESWQISYGGAVSEAVQKWLWERVAAYRTANGIGTIRVLERPDTNEVIGVTWFTEAEEEDKGDFWGKIPEEFSEEELEKLVISTTRWYMELLQKHGNYISE
jgi:hypothetical protein